MLRHHATPLGLPEGFSVLDTADAADLIDLVRDDRISGEATRRRFPRKAVLLDLYSRAVNTGTPLTGVIAETAPWCAELQPAIAAICRDYVVRKKALGLLDFDDLLLYWRTAAADPRVGPQLAAEFDHILVDEYQDVNALQVDVLLALRATDRRLTVVGDDAQAVYGFRAANPRHLLDFDLVFPDATTITLETNYRSSPQILLAANAVGAAAPEGFRAVLRAADPARSAGEPPQLMRCADEDAQSAAVCERVLDHRELGVALREQAVLFRAANHADALELELSRRRHPVRQVRRPALPRGRPHQGPAGAVPAGRQPARRDGVVPAAPAARRGRSCHGAQGHRAVSSCSPRGPYSIVGPKPQRCCLREYARSAMPP